VLYTTLNNISVKSLWSVYPSGAPQFIPGFIEAHVAQSYCCGQFTLPEHLNLYPVLVRSMLLNLWVSLLCNVDRCLSFFFLFSFIHCIVYPSLIYGFWLHLLVSSTFPIGGRNRRKCGKPPICNYNKSLTNLII